MEEGSVRVPIPRFAYTRRAPRLPDVNEMAYALPPTLNGGSASTVSILKAAWCAWPLWFNLYMRSSTISIDVFNWSLSFDRCLMDFVA